MTIVETEMRKLLEKADDAVGTAFGTSCRHDPILGDLSRIHAISMCLTRRHGLLLEDAVAAGLRHSGLFEVSQQVRFPITEAAANLVSTNGPSILDKVRLVFDAEAKHTFDLDLAAVSVDGRRAIAVDVKRGAGSTSGSRRAAVERDMHAIKLLLRSFFRQQGYRVDDVDVGIVDFYGSGGFTPALSLSRADLDGFFGVPVLPFVDALNERVREGVRRRVPEVIASIASEGRAPARGYETSVVSLHADPDDDTPVASTRSNWSEIFAARAASAGRAFGQGWRTR